jgi:hypothetical protein
MKVQITSNLVEPKVFSIFFHFVHNPNPNPNPNSSHSQRDNTLLVTFLNSKPVYHYDLTVDLSIVVIPIVIPYYS